MTNNSLNNYVIIQEQNSFFLKVFVVVLNPSYNILIIIVIALISVSLLNSIVP